MRFGVEHHIKAICHAGRLSGVLALCLLLTSNAGHAETSRTHILLQERVAAPAGFNGVCARYSWMCARDKRSKPLGREALNLAAAVNTSINNRVREVSDQRQYKQEEYWALPTAAGGDCEDFALAKKHALIGKGIAPERLLVATVLDRKRAPHAVLVLRTDDGDYVLDNLTSRIKPWRDTGYTFLRMQTPSSPGAWSAVLAGGILN